MFGCAEAREGVPPTLWIMADKPHYDTFLAELARLRVYHPMVPGPPLNGPLKRDVIQPP